MTDAEQERERVARLVEEAARREARLVLLDDLTAARALADKLKES